MAEEKVEARELNWRQLLPWTELFRFLQIALDAKKMLLAAAGILVTWIGWVILSVLFAAPYPDQPPDPGGRYAELHGADAWARFKEDRDQWNIMHEATGKGGASAYQVADLAHTQAEFDLVAKAIEGKDRAAALEEIDRLVRLHEDELRAKKSPTGGLTVAQGNRYRRQLFQLKPAGTIASAPWSEARGPNPFLLVTGQAGVPWESGRFWEWFAREQAPVMIEPVAKLLRPVVYFLSPRATGFGPRSYFLSVLLWTLVTWSIFGGAITRIAAVQVARGETVGMGEAVRFTTKRLLSYVMAPLFPLGGVLALTILAALLGLVFLIPVVGDILIGGALWFLFLLFGIGMALALVGLVGWPLMAAAISTEGTDAWEAASRSYGYVYQRPWQFLWNSLVAIVYGGLVIFFIGFLSSFAVYLSKWSVSQTPFISAADREPSFLFVYAPRSFGWRPLLLQGVKAEGVEVVQDGAINDDAYAAYLRSLRWWNLAGARIVQVWLIAFFLLMLGVGYSLFWCEVTIIYLLLRKGVEGAEMDEVHLEDEELDSPFGGGYVPTPAPAAAAPRPGGLSLSMVDPPKPSTAPPNPTTDAPPPGGAS